MKQSEDISYKKLNFEQSGSVNMLESNNIRLVDIIPVEQLQSLQDKFSLANGVSSIILDLNGVPVTQPSNFRDLCVSSSCPGQNCVRADRLIRGIHADSPKCRLSVTGTPIYVGTKHVANWTMGMCGFGGIIGPFLEAACQSTEKYNEIHKQLSDKLKAHFDNVCDLLKTTAKEITELSYSNIRLTQELLKRKESETKLAETENNFRSIFDNSVDGIILIGQDAIVKEWNYGYEKISGIPKEQAIGKNLWDLITPLLSKDRYSKEKIEQMGAQLAEIISNKETTTLFRYITNLQTQQERVIQTLYFPVFQIEETMMCAICRDFTEDAEKERELVAEKERLQALGDNYPNGCLHRTTFDPETKELKLIYLSKTWELISEDVSIDDALNDVNKVLALIFPDDLPRFMDVVMKSVETMTNLNVELRFCKNNQVSKWVQIASCPHLMDDLVVWDGFFLDITERKMAEQKLEEYRNSLEQTVKERTEEYEATNEELYATNEELYATNEEFAAINEELHNKNDQLEHEMAARKEAMQKLEDSENKLHNFIMQSSEGIVITNDEGKVIEWNPMQERITEIKREEAIGKYSWDLYQSLMPAEKAEERTEEFRKHTFWMLDPNNKQKHSKETEHDFYLPDKGERYVSLTSFQIAVGNKYYLGEIVRDTTERKLLDIELGLYRSQLEEMVISQTKELIESKERLTTLSDNLPGGAIFQLSAQRDSALQFTYISANFSNMFHVAVEDVMRDSTLFFNMIHQEDQKKATELFESNHSGFVAAECRVCLNTGNTMWIHLRSSYREQDDQLRVWDGFMTDITDRKNAEQELEETRRRQSILIKVLQIVQSAESIDEAVNTALLEIGEYAGVSRSYIFEKAADGKTVNNTYEWCNVGVTPEIDHLHDVPIEFVSDWFEAFEKNEYICASDIIELSATAYEQLSEQGIKSILVIPLKTNGIIYGFVGFDECSQYKNWRQKEVDLLISLSQIISTTTTRFRAEKSMQLSQQTMRTVLDNINAGIYVADFDTYEVLFANKMVKDQMGGDVEGKICWKVMQKGMTGPCNFCPNPKLLDDQKKPTGLYRWEVFNPIIGNWFECSDAAIEWIDGRLVHMEYATDITDRREAEEALRQSEELYRQLTVASPDAIIVCDTQGKVVYVSPMSKELFCISNDVNTDILAFDTFVHPHDLRKSLELFQSIVEGNESVRPQLLLMRYDGSEFFGEISSAAVKDDKGQITSVIMVIRDITQRKMDELELIHAKEKAEESDKLKSAFLANMSHEIRTPINGIVGFLNFLADDNLSSKRRQEYVSVVNNSSIQLVKLIDDIIDVAKIEAKQLSIRPTVFHLNDFMSELHIFFETYLQTNNKDKIALILDDSLFVYPDAIFVDPIRLRQVLTNLIGNAIKFTEKGYIGFGYKPLPPDKLEFWVEDSGIGLPADQLEVIFERFRQAELANSRKYGGTGLGLTISRSLVQMMGGDITVESAEGVGSMFRFTISYLPVTPEDELLLGEKNTGKVTGDYSFKGMTILLVEPAAMMCRYYEKLLAYTGATLIRAETVKQWIDVISQPKHIDVVIANASVFQDEYGEALRMVKSVRADLPLVLVIPERNEYFYRVMNDSRCNHVIEGTANYAMLYDVLIKLI